MKRLRVVIIAFGSVLILAAFAFFLLGIWALDSNSKWDQTGLLVLIIGVAVGAIGLVGMDE